MKLARNISYQVFIQKIFEVSVTCDKNKIFSTIKKSENIMNMTVVQ